ncbi:MAG: hypothetical protein KDB00_13430 [Planctomycetales bacterium]|nr:hypothetical protein [Planctomycetales bacterium]
MEAVRRWSAVLAALSMVAFFGDAAIASERNARSTNFLVHAPTQALAEAVAKSAEKYRDDLAIYWLGKRLPPWSTPCPIEVVAGPHLAAQGATTYNRSPVGNFQMKVIGSEERILDSVLPHEVTHTVMATHFGRPLPRWADEGICTTVEHAAERDKHEVMLRNYLSNRRGIAMNHLFLLTEYPSDMLPMYAQGYSVCRFLIKQSGPRQFISFLEDYMRTHSWTENVRTHYGYDSLRDLQESWLAWVAQGSGSVETFVSGRGRAGGSIAATTVGSAGPMANAADPGNLALNAPASINAPNSDNGGWYLRRLEQTAQGQIASSADSPGDHLAAEIRDARPDWGPPSVIHSAPYSASQPQAEQGFGQSTPMASSARSTPIYR